MFATRKRKIVIAGFGLLILACAAWGVVSFSRDKSPAVPKDLTVEALQAKAAQDPGKMFETAHQAMSRTDLTEEQRHAVRENVHAVMEAQMDKRMNDYFKAPPAQKTAILDKQIDEMVAHMKEMQQRRAERGGDDRRPPGPGSAANAGAGSSASGGNARAGRPGGPHREDTQQERKAHSESRDPDKAAQHMAYFTAMRQRMEERGIQMPFGPRGGPH